MRIHAAARPRDHWFSEPYRWTIHADDYDTAMKMIRDAVPDDWDLVEAMPGD